MDKWIRCKDKQPDMYGHYLVTMFAGSIVNVSTATYIPKTEERKDKWIPDTYLWGNVVAWMELPKPITYEEVDA